MSIKGLLNYPISVKTIIILGIIWGGICVIVAIYLLGGVKEGFTTIATGIGSAISYKIGDGVKNSWDKTPNDEDGLNPKAVPDLDRNMEYNSLVDLNVNVKDDLVFFNNNTFSPDCCPSIYSNSDGCACITPEQLTYLNSRGGNKISGGEDF